MQPDNKKVTIKEVAREAGVSITTVSRALNQTGRVDPDTTERIKATAARLGYRPSMAAQSLKTGKSRNIILVVPDIVNPFYSTMARKLQSLASKADYALTLYDTNENMQEELKAIELAGEMYLSGIVFASIYARDVVIDALCATGIPAVLLNSYDECALDSIHGRRGRGTVLATRHLLEMGHRRIGFVGGVRESTIAKSRKEGYLNALCEAGIPPDEKLIFEMGFSEDAGYKAGIYFASLHPRPTAICCANDMLAMGVLSALYEAGIPVPEQISLTGMDNIIYSRTSNPPLTTVTNDSEEFASLALEMLFDRIDRRYDGPPRERLLDRQLVLRGSVAPNRPDSPLQPEGDQ